MTVTIRAGRVEDAAAIANLHHEAVVAAYSSIFPPDPPPPTPAELTPDYDTFLADVGTVVLVAVRNTTTVGSVVLHPEPSVPSGWLLARLHVHPSTWRTGIGSVLHDRVIDLARTRGLDRLHLWTLEANDRARAMYERRGWVLVPGRKLVNGDLDPPIEDVLYELDLTTG
jgi:GNAT superfamily N-acetyltransferase